MPRVTDAHRAARREQVLDAARACFARQGFHATSMDDVIRESGLSAGAVYQYFRSKDELIVAAAGAALASIRSTLAAVDPAVATRPAVALAAVLERPPFVPGPDGVDITRLALHGWSEATRNAALHDLVEQGYRTFRRQIVTLIEQWQAAGAVRPGLDPESSARALLSLILGYVVQRALFGDAVRPADYQRAITDLLG